MKSFEQLGLSAPVLRVLEELSFEKPTEIQEQAIPYLISAERDFIGLAQTGTGKTAAFGLPLLERLDPSAKHTQALILAPTRELGKQIAEQLDIFSKYVAKFSVLPVYGGAAIGNQIKALKRPQHVIIATPGRLIDLIKRRAVKLDKVEVVVLDEADEMLNMGFKEDLDYILSYTPEEKQTWLFSATMPREIRRIVKTYMENPIEVKVSEQNQVNTNIEHRYVVVRQSNKAEALTRLLDADPAIRGVVFCRTKRDTQALAERLLKHGYQADALHGDLSQAQRDRVMKRFRSHELQVLIATDVAARGIDVNDLTHVIHFTLPDEVAYYTHRSGRTARAGKQGVSVAFVDHRDLYRIGRLSKQLKVEFSRMMIPRTVDIAEQRVKSWCMDVLAAHGRNKDNRELLEQANVIFGGLSKEELTAKVLALELERMNLGSADDLNVDVSKDRGGRRKSQSQDGGKRSSSRRREGGKRKGSSFNHKSHKPQKRKFRKKKKY